MWISRFPKNSGKCEAVAMAEAVVKICKTHPAIKATAGVSSETLSAAILVSHNSTFMHCTVFIGQPPNHLIILKSISFHSTEIIIVVRIFGLQCFHSWSSKVKGQGRIRLAAHSLLHILFPTCWIHHESVCYHLATFVHTVGVMDRRRRTISHITKQDCVRSSTKLRDLVRLCSVMLWHR